MIEADDLLVQVPPCLGIYHPIHVSGQHHPGEQIELWRKVHPSQDMGCRGGGCVDRDW